MEVIKVTKPKEERIATVLRSADSSVCDGRAFMVIIGAIEDIGAIKRIMIMMRISLSKGSHSQTATAIAAQVR